VIGIAGMKRFYQDRHDPAFEIGFLRVINRHFDDGNAGASPFESLF
jgi:hypothetical protein